MTTEQGPAKAGVTLGALVRAELERSFPRPEDWRLAHRGEAWSLEAPTLPVQE